MPRTPCCTPKQLCCKLISPSVKGDRTVSTDPALPGMRIECRLPEGDQPIVGEASHPILSLDLRCSRSAHCAQMVCRSFDVLPTGQGMSVCNSRASSSTHVYSSHQLRTRERTALPHPAASSPREGGHHVESLLGKTHQCHRVLPVFAALLSQSSPPQSRHRPPTGEHPVCASDVRCSQFLLRGWMEGVWAWKRDGPPIFKRAGGMLM